MKQAKKLLLSAGVVLAFIAYSWQQRHKTVALVLQPADNKSDQTANTPQPSNPTSQNATQSQSLAVNTPITGKYKDGQYTGTAADAFYGLIQVKAIVSNGKITDIKFLQSPNDRPNSIYVNSVADPILKQEAVKVQSAKVDIVSGATETSLAFIESLTNALDQAV